MTSAPGAPTPDEATRSHTVRVFAPASVSNVACGFDALGFAVTGLGDEVVAALVPGGERGGTEASREPGVRVRTITGDGGKLPTDAIRNTAAVAARAVLTAARGELERRGLGSVVIELDIHKKMPLSSGLGSSAASAVGGAVAAFELLRRTIDFDLSREDLLECALAGEVVASGGRHADNVAPSLLGGVVLIRALEPEPDLIELPAVDDWLWCALARPELAVDTLQARQALGSSVALGDAIRQWANLGALVAAIYRRDLGLLARALEDRIAEPVRKGAVPGFDQAMDTARSAGALGGSLSGSGPTLFALCESEEAAVAAANAMSAEVSRAAGVQCAAQVSTVGAPGARVVEGPVDDDTGETDAGRPGAS